MNTKRFNQVFFSLFGGALFVATVLFCLSPFNALAKPAYFTASVIRYVDSNGTDISNVCTASVTPCQTIQHTVDLSQDGDEIRVAAGTYSDMNNYSGLAQIVYISKTLSIIGGYTTTNWNTSNPSTNLTTLDAQNSGRVMYITGNISPSIQGLHITGGNSYGLGGDPWQAQDAGGGLYIITATAQISGNWILNNTASYGTGGGIFLNQSKSVLNSNIISGNTSGSFGGGISIWFSDALINDNVIANNNTNGVFLYGYTPTFERNLITGNIGPGLNFYYGWAYLNGNTITANHAYYGGGISLITFSGAIMNGNIITGNYATSKGGGLYVSWHSYAYLNNDLVADNQTDGSGSGIYAEGATIQVVHTTIARNNGGNGSGIYIGGPTGPYGLYYSTVVLTNTILVSHSVGISVTGGNTVSINSLLWYKTPITISKAITAVIETQHQYYGDPVLAADGYHLMSGSLAINKGLLTSLKTDIDSDLRPDGCFPDLGADEYISGVQCKYIYLPLALKN